MPHRLCLLELTKSVFVFLQSSYKQLIRKVLNAFKPGRFLMTLFANEVSKSLLSIVSPSLVPLSLSNLETTHCLLMWPNIAWW